jgi:glycosyltransferase involved in cell wall biosynthesis
MNIGINATFLNEKPTGVGIFTREISSRLCELNSNTTVYTSTKLDNVPEKNIRKTPQIIKGSMSLTNNFNRFLFCNLILPFIVKKNKIDLLFCPIMEFPFFRSIRLIITVHDLHPVYFPDQFGLAAQHFKLSLKLLSRQGSRVIVPSNFVKKELLKNISLSAEHVDVVPLGYDANLFKPHTEEQKHDLLKSYGIKEPYILFIGSLFQYKNIGTLIDAFREIKNRIPHSLVVIGKKDLARENLEETTRVHYLDYVNNRDLPKFYSYAEVYVNPSLVEGFGITVLEAMACGTPVISSHGGSLPEVVGKAGIFFNPENSSELGEKILAVIQNNNLRKELREKGFRQIKKFSWDNTSQNIFNSCKEILKTTR